MHMIHNYTYPLSQIRVISSDVDLGIFPLIGIGNFERGPKPT